METFVDFGRITGNVLYMKSSAENKRLLFG